MVDFLIFKRFISTDALIVFYYIGALILPFVAWFSATWLINKYQIVRSAYELGRETFWHSLTLKQKSWLLLFFFTVFIFAELFWRMLFEFLIAYMQIRDALVH